MSHALLSSLAVVFCFGLLTGTSSPSVAEAAWRTGVPPAGSQAPTQAALPVGNVVRLAEDGYDPAVAYSAKHDEYLVVWGDPYAIYAKRIGSRGETRSPQAIAVDPTIWQSDPDVAYDPMRDRYLIVWSKQNIYKDWDIVGQFVSWDLATASAVFAIEDGLGFYSTEPTLAHAPDQAGGQGEFLVVWQNAQPEPGHWFIAGRRVNADGSGLPAPSFTVASASPKNLSAPDMAYNQASHEYLVVYDDRADVFGQRVSGAGTPVGGAITLAGWPDPETLPAVGSCKNAPANAQFLVAWTSEQPSGRSLYARMVGGDGTPGSFTARNPIAATGAGADVACRWDLQYMVTWGAQGTQANLVYADGRTEDPVRVSPKGGGATIAAGDPNFLFVWTQTKEENPAYTDLYGCIVGHTKPTASFSVRPEAGGGETVFQFDASASTDAEYTSEELEVRWDWEDDGTYDTVFSHTKTAAWRYFAEGVHTIRLEVRDGYGLTDSTTRQVTTGNAAPVASFTVTPESGGAGTVFQFDASFSGDPDGNTEDLEVRWDWTNDGAYDTEWSKTKTITYAYPPDRFGTYWVKLQVRDPGGLMGETMRPVTLYRQPIASLTVRPEAGDLCTTFYVDASTSSGAYAPVYRWAWGDSRHFDTDWSTDPTAFHRYNTPGTRTIRVEVAEDPNGVSDVATFEVAVRPGCALFLPSSSGR